MIDLMKPDEVRREAERRRRLREQGAESFDAPAAVDVPAIAPGVLEAHIEREGDRLMQKLGFEVIRFSHPGKTKQTEGIADRRYYHRRRKLAVWWEVKSDSGRQRPGQKLFQELVESVDEPYVLGTHEALIDWLVDACVAERVIDPLGDVELRPLPFTREVRA